MSAFQTIPIITYHSLDDSGSVISTPPAAFAYQMRRLRDRGHYGIRFIDLIDAWDGKITLPSKPVVLTFDDAFANLNEYALPILSECGFTGTIFAVADYCGRKNDWPTQPPGAPILPLMTDTDLRDAAKGGMEIGSHTLTHPFLARLAPAAVGHELADAQSALQDRLGVAVQTLAYPYGSFNAPVVQMTQSLYRAACTVQMNRAGPGDNRWQLPRLDMYYWRNPKIFNWFGTARGSGYLALRRLARSGRALLGKG